MPEISTGHGRQNTRKTRHAIAGQGAGKRLGVSKTESAAGNGARIGRFTRGSEQPDRACTAYGQQVKALHAFACGLRVPRNASIAVGLTSG